MEVPRDGEAWPLPSPRSPGSPRSQSRRCSSTDGAAAPVPSAFETPPNVLRGERSPTNSELGNHRSSPGVDSAARRPATQLDELAVDPAPPMDPDSGVPLGELRRAADLAPPSPPVAEPPARSRRRLADGQAGQGEQAHEAPAAGSPRRRQRGDRVYCPKAQCPCADSLAAPGWSNTAAMHGHIDMHLARGEVSQEWLDRHKRTRCRVCTLSVAAGRGVHPTCRPQERAQAARRDDDAEGGPALPSADALFSQRARTLKHAPRASRTLWAQALTRSLAAIAAYNTEDAWLEFAMLPKVLHMPPPRGGRKNAKAAAFTTDRITPWLEGNRMGLWQDVRESAPAKQNDCPSTEQLRMRRAVALAAEGFDRKACAALLSRGVCEETDENVQRLRELHLEAPLLACPAPAELAMSIEITTEMVESALRSFPRDPAAGPSGLRAQHMMDALAPAHRGTVLEQLAAAVQVAVRGEAPQAVAPYMAGATLLGLIRDRYVHNSTPLE